MDQTTDNAAPARTAADALADLGALIDKSKAQAIPLNLHTAIELLHEHAGLAVGVPINLAEFDARLQAVEAAVKASGIAQV